MKIENPEKIIEWLKSRPTLKDIDHQYPELVEDVRSDIAEIISHKTSAELVSYLEQMNQKERVLKKGLYSNNRGEKNIGKLAVHLLSSRVAHLVIKQHLVSEASGVKKGKIRFNLFNGFLAQKLFFRVGLERKPVSLFWFRIIWPLVWQKRLLMPLVQPEGIYCFYSSKLVDSLVALIGEKDCLEIASGDGTLAAFLSERGVSVKATDDYSWKHEVNYPKFVTKQDAVDALREYLPEVVICSWPPAGNGFERYVFRSSHVKLYIVIGSRHHFGSGNWDDYNQQSAFDLELDERLSCQVLPPELDAAVYIFKRR
ncbi:MAG: hypothetical protein PHN84_05445 [Desulfuromonadaceae bacterium]|nr:hypothetical protein [Desulfuromonadaceae bacterium]MDD2855738.1 hypothetical protein [Desulfuromonadaceae bacterium]